MNIIAVGYVSGVRGREDHKNAYVLHMAKKMWSKRKSCPPAEACFLLHSHTRECRLHVDAHTTRPSHIVTYKYTGLDMSLSWPNPPLDRSILGWDPVDEFSVQIGEWLLQHAQFKEHVEIEAKVGRIITRDGDRIHLPVRNETIVEMQHNWKFESTMSDVCTCRSSRMGADALMQEQHKRLNLLLNKAVEDRKRGISYERQNEVDLFFRRPEGGGSVRVTKDAASFATKEILVKRRIADLNVFCPNHALDYRISINIEEPQCE